MRYYSPASSTLRIGFNSEQGRYYTEVGGLKWEQRRAFWSSNIFPIFAI